MSLVYDEEHKYGVVRINARQYQKCADHCCNVKLGKRPCYCRACREVTELETDK